MAKIHGKVKQLKKTVEGNNNEKEKLSAQKKMIEGLQQNFMKKYQEELKKAQDIEK